MAALHAARTLTTLLSLDLHGTTERAQNKWKIDS